jgi:hypothetical protein
LTCVVITYLFIHSQYFQIGSCRST